LKEGPPETRPLALLALERAAGAESLADLRPLLTDRAEGVRLAAARAVAQHAPGESLDTLIGLLDGESVQVRADAVALLKARRGRGAGATAYDPAERRREEADRWRKWLKDEGATAKLSVPPRDLRVAPSRTLLCLFNPFGVVELGADGKRVFTTDAI